jgi:23S rRNA (uracil1939-C5)-methyltransferase
MQHLEPRAQLAIKQRALEDQLKHLGGVRPDEVLRPLAGPTWSVSLPGTIVGAPCD